MRHTTRAPWSASYPQSAPRTDPSGTGTKICTHTCNGMNDCIDMSGVSECRDNYCQ